MASLLDIAKIQALAATSAYGGQRLLSSMSEALALSIIPILADWRIWSDNPDLMTDIEKSTIRDIVDTLSAEIMEGSIMANASYDLLYSVSYDYNRATIPVNYGHAAGYDEIMIHAYGLMTDRANSADAVLIQLNGDTNVNNYESLNSVTSATATSIVSNYKTEPGVRIQRGAAGYDGGDGYPTSWKLRIANPESNKIKLFSTMSMTFGNVESENGLSVMSGKWENSEPIRALEIIPVFGTEFKVGSAPTFHLPSEIKVNVYGIG